MVKSGEEVETVDSKEFSGVSVAFAPPSLQPARPQHLHAWAGLQGSSSRPGRQDGRLLDARQDLAGLKCSLPGCVPVTFTHVLEKTLLSSWLEPVVDAKMLFKKKKKIVYVYSMCNSFGRK